VTREGFPDRDKGPTAGSGEWPRSEQNPRPRQRCVAGRPGYALGLQDRRGQHRWRRIGGSLMIQRNRSQCRTRAFRVHWPSSPSSEGGSLKAQAGKNDFAGLVLAQRGWRSRWQARGPRPVHARFPPRAPEYGFLPDGARFDSGLGARLCPGRARNEVRRQPFCGPLPVVSNACRHPGKRREKRRSR
jgi:hypothetical protein